jgi:hypothetical protein
MTNDGDFEAILADARTRIAAVQPHHDSTTREGNRGGLLILAAWAVPLAATGLLAVVVTSDAGSAGSRWLLGGSLLAGSFVIAAVLIKRGQRMQAPWVAANDRLGETLDEALVRPLVERLVPGATLSRPLVPSSGFHPSLLYDEVRGKALAVHNRIEGTIAGLPVVLEEVPSSFDENIEGGWIARFALPFTVDRHVRIRGPKPSTHTSRFNRGFEKLTEATARLGSRSVIDAALLGPPAASGGLLPDDLLTEALFERLRASPDVDLAVAGRDLWVSIPRGIRAFDGHVTLPTSLEPWRKAAQAIAELESIVTAIRR